MPKNKTKKVYMKPSQIVRNKLCNRVPCGDCVKNCPPSYCVEKKAISKNWCKRKMKYSGKSRKIHPRAKNSVYAKTLHRKIPYIWRFIDTKTRKKMISLAKKPISEINI